jgi:restriction system protein
MSRAWVIRSGRYGERDDWALTNGVSGGGWPELTDLTPCQDRDAIADAVRLAFPGAAQGMIHN